MPTGPILGAPRATRRLTRPPCKESQLQELDSSWKSIPSRAQFGCDLDREIDASNEVTYGTSAQPPSETSRRAFTGGRKVGYDARGQTDPPYFSKYKINGVERSGAAPKVWRRNIGPNKLRGKPAKLSRTLTVFDRDDLRRFIQKGKQL